MSLETRERPLIVGEVLFDRFPDGARILGGAPFNVAWHLHGFGEAPLFVSCVGEDEAGRAVQAAMGEWGMDPSGVRVDPEHATGMVDVRFTEDGHTFEILADRAWDHVSLEQLRRGAEAANGLVYQGSLIMRSERVRSALLEFHEQNEIPLFVDINLRDPFWRADDFPWLLRRAHWVKINDEELEVIAGELGLPGDQVTRSRRLREDFDLELLIVTLGEKGARALPAGGEPVTVTPDSAIAVVDTVGAGDAFTSVVLRGLMNGWPLPETMERAQRWASSIVGQRGATCRDRTRYD